MAPVFKQKIAIKFTEDLVGAIGTSFQTRKELKTGIIVSGTSTGSLANLTDGNTGTNSLFAESIERPTGGSASDSKS